MGEEISKVDNRHPVVLRMEGLFPADLGGYELHRRRKGGDLGHVDETRSGLNRRLIGDKDWAQRAIAEIEDMRVENFANELEGLQKRRRKAELAKRVVEGPKDPWRGTRHGPLREVIIMAHQDWFASFDQSNMDDLFNVGTFICITANWMESDKRIALTSISRKAIRVKTNDDKRISEHRMDNYL